MENLRDLLEFFDDITFVSYFTVYPDKENIAEYIKNFNNLLLQKENANFMLLGPKLRGLNTSNLPDKISIYNSIENLVEDL